MTTGRKRSSCPVFGCGNTNLARLANHLDQVHDLGTEERVKWLKWSKIWICVLRQGREATATDKELNIERTVESLVKRQEEMATNFNVFSTKNREELLLKHMKD